MADLMLCHPNANITKNLINTKKIDNRYEQTAILDKPNCIKRKPYFVYQEINRHSLHLPGLIWGIRLNAKQIITTTTKCLHMENE